MTETRFTWQWLFVVAGIGLLVGLAFGLIVGWVILPVARTGVEVSALNAGAQNDYIELVANTFAFDNDLSRAKSRLTLLKDSNIVARVETLAKALKTRQDPSASNVATLAVELGSTDSSLQVLASSQPKNTDASPTKYAQLGVQPTPPPEATSATAATEAPTDASPPTEAPTDQPTPVPSKRKQTVAPKNTPVPLPTSQPQPATALMPQFNPSYPDQWWNGVQFVAANVAAGQQYWHLKSALYCDVLDQRNNCPSLPGGGMDHTIYVSLQNPDGSCANGTLKHETNTGDTKALEQKNVLYAWNSCATTDFEWNMYGEGNDIWVDGPPSDRINGLCMCNKTPPPGGGILQGHAHVRYYLIFQLTNR
jgi:hypothetical protein